MPVPTLITDLSQTESSNGPDGTVDSPNVLDGYQRALGAFIAQLRDGKGHANPVTLASATSTDIGGQNSQFVEISGTTTITGFGTSYNGPRFLRFTGSLTLTHGASLALPGAANIVTVAGDTAIAVPNLALNGWNVYVFQRVAEGPTFSAYLAASGGSVADSTFTKVLFDTESWDTTANYASSRFTPSVAGYYQVNATLQLSLPVPGFLTIYKNGAAFKRGMWNNLASGAQQLAVSGLVNCNGTTDYIEIYAYQASGAAVTPQGGAALTWFDGSMARRA